MLRLSDYVLSDDAYKVRLMLALLGVSYESEAVDVYPGGGTVPVLTDGDLVLSDPQLILVHLAKTRDPPGQWLPANPEIGVWLGFARTELGAVSEARLMAMLGQPGDFEAARERGYQALRALDDHLADRTDGTEVWLVGSAPSIADIAVFPAVALSNDAGIGLEDFPALNLWQRRVRKLPGFIGMPGIPDYF
jgi:glutathione S-transferase